MQEEQRGLSTAFPDGRNILNERSKPAKPATSVLEGGSKGTFGYWRIEFTPRLTAAQWDAYREIIERHKAFSAGVYSKSKCLNALREIVPDMEIVG